MVLRGRDCVRGLEREGSASVMGVKWEGKRQGEEGRAEWAVHQTRQRRMRLRMRCNMEEVSGWGRWRIAREVGRRGRTR